MLWNIQGFDETVNTDEDFNYVLSNNDIVVLTETWLSNPCDIKFNNFYTFHNIPKQNINARRPSGGIPVLIRSNLRKSATGKRGDFLVYHMDETM